jgi:hypothetical protein
MMSFFRTAVGQSLMHFESGDVNQLRSHRVRTKVKGDGQVSQPLRHWLAVYNQQSPGPALWGLHDPRINRLFASDFAADALGPGWACDSLCKDRGEWYSACFYWLTPSEHVAQALTLHFHAYSTSRPYPAINLNTYVHHPRSFRLGEADNYDPDTCGLLGTVHESITARLAPVIIPDSISHTLQLPDSHVAEGTFAPWRVLPVPLQPGTVPFQVPHRHLRPSSAASGHAC